MTGVLRNHGSTLSLKRARARLGAWQARVLAARDLYDELEGDDRADVRPLLRELGARFDQAATDVQRLERSEGSWQDARAAVDRSVDQLEEAWDAISRVIVPKREERDTNGTADRTSRAREQARAD